MNHLIDKFLTNTITNKELDELRNWLQDEKHQIFFKTYMRDHSDVNTTLQEIDFTLAYSSIWNGIKKSNTPRKLHVRWAKYAALFIGLTGTVVSLYLLEPFSNNPKISNELSPQITLELEDGTKKYLNETGTEVITNVDGDKIVTHHQKKLLYTNEGNTNTETLTYNILTIPYGKKFQVVLSDGSHVYLNSGSSLRFPTKFIRGKPRDVFLDGEAYFIVEKDSNRPFTVITDEMNTRVLGTKFNVSSYKNENNTSTVLVEGSVGVYDASKEYSDKNQTFITPGQRAIFESNEVTVDQVNTQKYIAWTFGQLYFVNDRFDLILKELERHFNVTISNSYTALNTELLTGTFETETLEQILIAFKAYKSFEFIIEADTITIQQPKQ